MIKHFFYISLTFLFSAGILTASAQTEYERYKQKYPKSEALFIHQATSVKITNEKGKLKIVSKHTESFMPLTDIGVMHNSKSISSSSFVETSDVKASVQVPNKSSYKTIKVTDIVLKDDMGDASFYDDSKSYNITYPGMVLGCKTNVEYMTTYHDPHFFGNYFFGNYLPVDSSDITIETAKGVDLCYKEFNLEGYNIQFTKKETSKGIIYKWKAIKMPKIEDESNGPNPRYYTPHIVFRICGYQNGETYTNVLKSTEDLYSWYADLTKSTNKENCVDLHKITDSLVAGAADDEEKVRRIFYWVQDKIAYVAIEDGLGGFIPRDAGMVFSRRYGDCKDMASIITTMIRYAGLNAWLTWIGTRDIPYSYTDVPTPHSDNHMIAAWKDKSNKVYFLDATGKHHAFGYPTGMIQGKEALLGIGPDKFEIVKVPQVDADKNTAEEIVDVFPDGDGIKGTTRITLTGFEKSHFQAYAEIYNYDEKINYVKRVFPKGNNKMMIDTLILKDDGKEMPLVIEYTFHVPGYAKFNQNEMYVNLNLDKSFAGGVIDQERKVDLEIEHKSLHKSTLNFHLPKEYKLTTVPKDQERKENEYAYKINYKINNDVVTLYNEFEMGTLMLEKKNFSNWNTFVKSYISAASETIVLKK